MKILVKNWLRGLKSETAQYIFLLGPQLKRLNLQIIGAHFDKRAKKKKSSSQNRKSLFAAVCLVPRIILLSFWGSAHFVFYWVKMIMYGFTFFLSVYAGGIAAHWYCSLLWSTWSTKQLLWAGSVLERKLSIDRAALAINPLWRIVAYLGQMICMIYSHLMT